MRDTVASSLRRERISMPTSEDAIPPHNVRGDANDSKHLQPTFLSYVCRRSI